VNAVEVIGPAVILQGLALLDTRALVIRGIKDVQRMDGITPHPRLLALVSAIDAAIIAGEASDQRHPDPPRVSLEGICGEQSEIIGTRQAAQILGTSARQVQRIAASLNGYRLPSRCWTFSKLDVQSYLEQRNLANERTNQ